MLMESNIFHLRKLFKPNFSIHEVADFVICIGVDDTILVAIVKNFAH